MDIKLEKIKFIPSMTQETYCFNAHLYVNGMHVGYAGNRGHGGPTDISHKQGGLNSQFVKDTHAWAATLPHLPIMLDAADCGEQMPYTEPDGSVKLFPQTLEDIVNDLVHKWIQEVYYPAKENAKYKRRISNSEKPQTIYLLKSEPEYERVLFSAYTPAIALGLRKQHGEDLKEIINERFLPEIERPGHPVYEANQKSLKK